MAKIVHKLNLNKTPQLVEDNSMIFAKNIMLGKDGTIRRDKAFVERLSNLNNILYQYIQNSKSTTELLKSSLIGKSYEDSPEGDNERIQDLAKIQEYSYIIESTSAILDNNLSIGTGTNKQFRYFTIIEIIPYNTKFYILCDLGVDNIIVEYDEISRNIKPYYTAWKYSGGTITGNCSINLRNEIILTIAESGAEIDVPLKTINLSKAKYTDDESWYTQTPILDVFNLEYIGDYQKSIPNGVYQFFARFEISENNYTNWFIVSSELFAGNNTVLHTHQGGVNYLNTHRDSDNSFILKLNKISNATHYEKVQFGFLLSHDEEIYARSWKTFNFKDTNTIYFDYNQDDIKEIDANDLLRSVFNIYNVKQITQFKNKQYISNYKETDFNPELSGYASNINIGVKKLVYSYGKQYVDITSGTKFKKLYDAEYYSTDVEPNIKYIKTLNGDSVTNYVLEGFHSLLNYKASNETRMSRLMRLDIYDEAQSPATTLTYNNFIRYSLQIANGTPQTTSKSIREPYFTDSNDNEFNNLVEYLEGKIDNIKPITNVELVKDEDSEDPLTKYNIVYKDKNNIQLSFTRHQIYHVPGIGNEERDDTVTFNIYLANLTLLTIDLNPTTSTDDLKYHNSLLPEQTYDFYVHFVKKTGETTNGYFVQSITIKDDGIFKFIDDSFYSWENLADIVNESYIPVFDNITIPNGYEYCYFSIKRNSGNFVQVFGLTNTSDLATGGNNRLAGYSIDYNLRLITQSDNVQDVSLIKVNTDESTEPATKSMKFRHSADGAELITFGSIGLFITSSANLDTYKSNGYIVLDYKNDNDINNLVKCTPYINSYIINEAEAANIPVEFNEYDLNLLGYLNAVVMPYFNTSTYVSGGDKYTKTIDRSGSTANLKLTDASFINDRIDQYTIIHKVFSNHNLTYLAFSEGVQFTPKSVTEEGASGLVKILAIATDSINLSDVYTLPKMYKEYTRYLCTKRENNTITKFDNTIRSSKLEIDEDTLNRFIFEPTDYYNVPTTKGIITNLAAVGNAILVHTQDSLFKFVGNNTLTANGGEDVQLKESEVFDTGITEVFGSEFGYAGLKDKKHSIITELGYIFFDYDAKVLYLYAGEGQISPISEPIDKLLKHANIQNVYFANDYYNDRFLISIVFNNNNVLEYATLSFNYKAKSFISLHDFKFNKSFSTKTKCYLLHTSENAIDKIIEYGTFEISSTENPIDTDFIIENDNLYPTYDIDDDATIKASIVDIIFNTSYETIKALNTISWVCNNIIKFTEIGQGIDNIDNMAEENLNSEYKGDYLRLYTDTTATDLIDLSGRSNDEHLINQSALNENSYKLPRYNKGRWNLNYFRNILNTTQIQYNKNNYRDSDNHSLIYGKYIVARFIFDNSVNDFKFENIEFNVSIYE